MAWTFLQLAFTAVLTVILSWLFYLYLNKRRLYQCINKIPGPPTVPLVGNALDFLVDHTEYLPIFLNYAKKYPRMFRLWLGSDPYIILFHHKTIEPVMTSLTVISKAQDYDHLHPWLGTGLLNSDGEKWKIRRKLLTPAFHFRILNDFITVFNEQSNILVQQLKKHLGKEVDIFPLITNCVLDIICETAMGRHVNAQGNAASDYVKATDRIKVIVHNRHFTPWLKPNWIFNLIQGKEHNWCLNVLHSFTEKVIKEKKAKFQLQKPSQTEDDDGVYGKKKRLAFLDLLLEVSDGGKVLNDQDIREEVDTFMFEGHDTTAAAISFSVYLLALYPDVQKKLYSELQSIFGSDKTRPVTADDLTRMNYLECIIKEALRIYPSVPVLARRLKEEIVINGYTIPTETTVTVSPYLLHRDPEVFPDPENFNPDRFLPENTTGRNPYAYIPFSAGPRNCIGQKFAIMEEKVVLTHILRSYQVRLMEPEKGIPIVAELILKSANGIKVYLTPRN